MKKILLTSIIGFMALVPCFDCLADNSYSVSEIAIDKALRENSKSIDSEEFLKLWSEVSASTKDYSLNSLVTPCLGAVKKSNMYDVCRLFVAQVYHFHNEYVESINKGVINYINDTFPYIEHTDDIVAKDIDGEYFVSYIKYPKSIKNMPEDIEEQWAVFSENGKFICVMDSSNVCKHKPDSDTVFVYKPKSGTVRLLEQMDKQRYDAYEDAGKTSWDKVPYFDTAIIELADISLAESNEASRAFDKLNHIRFEQNEEKKHLEYRLNDCIEQAKYRYKQYIADMGFAIVRDMIEVKFEEKECDSEYCYLNLNLSVLDLPSKKYLCNETLGQMWGTESESF